VSSQSDYRRHEFNIYLDAPDSANTVLLFYSTSLAHTIGPSFRPPDIALLAQHWLESSSKPVLSVDRARSVDLMTISEDDIRQAIRVALDAEIARQPDEDIIKLVEEWQEQRMFSNNFMK
jgi:WD repeat-containing protein 7